MDQGNDNVPNNGKFFETIRDPLNPYLLALPDEALASLSRVCRFFRDHTHEERARRKSNELIRRIICGEEVMAEAMLEEDLPSLLDNRGEATDYSGRKIQNLTPFQAALCGGDVQMCERIKFYFDQLPSGSIKRIRQFDEIFPRATGGFSGHLERQQQMVFDFSAIVSAITNASPDQLVIALNKEGAQWAETDLAREKSDTELTLTEALNRFREQFTKKSHGEIVFNPQHLKSAFKCYAAQFRIWNETQRDLFWRQVIGFVQRFFPAYDAQVWAQGLHYVVANGEVLQRSLSFRRQEEKWTGSFYPVNFEYSGLGFDYAVEGIGFAAVSGCGWPKWVSKFIENRNIQIEKLAQVSLPRPIYCPIS
ncbi:MAG: hypothetical protein A3F41_00535 [Coxiella sp. RIFCSPHIGHO2_12_FULL_44_14]|nr:MAG: hypothetical protein A3F41_00535 [Coxiella sp. RIFCSPHIGHO2_12_FULL_44_14]